MLGLLVLAGCGITGEPAAYVLPASYSDPACGGFARARAEDAALQGHPVQVQSRVAGDVYKSCLSNKKPPVAP